MPDTSDQKSYELEPSWKHYLLPYLICILTIPLAGIGLIAFYFVRKKQKSRTYIITDTQISTADSKYQRNVDLVNIEDIVIHQSRLQEKLDIGNLRLQTSALEVELIGIENPGRLKAILEKAIQAELQHRQEKKKTEPREPKYSPGSMDKMEYLTGLWQQGLISEEDYEKERKHFE